MPINVNTNVQSLNAQRLLSQNTMSLNKSLEQLASGFRINKASDDAAGLQISETLRSQIRGSEKANDNVQDGINVLNTADGSLSTITDNLQRMRELVVQGANDTLGVDQRSAINKELLQLTNDIDRIAKATEFNGKKLFSSVTTYNIQVGAESASATNVLNIGSASSALGTLSKTSLGIGSGTVVAFSVRASTSALAAISKIDIALQRVGNRRASIGALTNRLSSASQNLAISIENFSASESRIRNVDVAKESATMTKNQILQQAAATVLSQANQAPQLALKLLG
ncbi:MAG: flagellin [Vampirovibrionales bacterium]